MKLSETLPEFSTELRELLIKVGREDIAVQVGEVEFERYSYDDSCDAASIFVQSPRELNVVEKNIIGVKYEESVSVDHPYLVNVDIDNFGRLRAIELLKGSKIARILSKMLNS